MVEWLFLAVPWGCLRFVIVVFPDYTHLLFLNKFRKTKYPDLYKKYCQLRNLVQRETRISKREYITNTIEENVGYSNKLWDELKKLVYSNKKKE